MFCQSPSWFEVHLLDLPFAAAVAADNIRQQGE